MPSATLRVSLVWRVLQMTLPDAPLDIPRGQQILLEAAYSTPVRAYHNYAHVQEVLRHYADVAAGPGWTQPVETYLAVLYHDAIYEAGRKDNETRSAELAIAQAGIWLGEAGIDALRVAELIRLTERHGQLSPADFGGDGFSLDAMHFLDCDMAILGSEPAAFDAYDCGIADEYRGHVPAFLFKLNRRRFLKGLLSRERIFLSDWFHQRYDAPARDNLRRVLDA
jgi:predicted metal-dependent HD superfamily phosphohydrolase